MTKTEQAAQLLEELKQLAVGNASALDKLKVAEEEFKLLVEEGDQEDTDWGGIERDIYGSLDTFATTMVGHANSVARRFIEGALNGKGSYKIDSGIMASILANAFKVNHALTIVKDVARIFQSVLTKAFKEQQSTLTMSDIVDVFKEATDKFIKENKKRVFLNFKDQYDCKSEREINDAYLNIIDSFKESLITEKQVEKAITLAWIRSTKDNKWDADLYAGCFKITVEYKGEFKHDGTPTGNIGWVVTSCEVDDVPHPEGTKAILATLYEGETLLKDIFEIATVVYITPRNHFEVNRKGIEQVTASGYKKANSNEWVSRKGNQKLFEAFISSSNEFQPCISDLK